MNEQVTALSHYIKSSFTDETTTVGQIMEEFDKYDNADVLESLDSLIDESERSMQETRNAIQKLEIVISTYGQLDIDLQPSSEEVSDMLKAYNAHSKELTQFRAKRLILTSLKSVYTQS